MASGLPEFRYYARLVEIERSGRCYDLGMKRAVLPLLLFIPALLAQRSRYTSPEAHASASIAGHRISVDYYAPSMHGRRIMGALVPFGQVWCTGANIATAITTDAALQLGDAANGLRLPKGSYSIWTIPGPTAWTLIVNRETGQFHLNYDSSQDFGRMKMNVKKLEKPVETLRIDVRPESGDKGVLALVWETTEASVPIRVVDQAGIAAGGRDRLR